MATLAEKIVRLLDVSPGLSDREITDTLFGHSANPQPVNQACRNLASRGLLERRQHADGPIGNFPIGVKSPGMPWPLRAPLELSSPIDSSAPGDSAEQREAEVLLVNLLSDKLGVRLAKRPIKLPGGGALQVDGASDFPSIICEAWAHVGPAKSAQKHKLMTDAFKLIFAAQLLPSETRKILVVGDAEAVQHLRGRSWMAQALHANNVEIEIVELPRDARDRLREAQRRQFR